LADRIILIGKGQVLMDGPLSQLKNKYVTQKTVTIDHRFSTNKFLPQGTTLISTSPERTIFSVDLSKNNVSDVISEVSQNVDILDISVDSRPIEEIIVDLYKAYEI